jgi:hypothetical protein
MAQTKAFPSSQCAEVLLLFQSSSSPTATSQAQENIWPLRQLTISVGHVRHFQARNHDWGTTTNLHNNHETQANHLGISKLRWLLKDS